MITGVFVEAVIRRGMNIPSLNSLEIIFLFSFSQPVFTRPPLALPPEANAAIERGYIMPVEPDGELCLCT